MENIWLLRRMTRLFEYGVWRRYAFSLFTSGLTGVMLKLVSGNGGQGSLWTHEFRVLRELQS